MKICQTIEQMRSVRRAMGTTAFVPTMGALHEGHLALIRHAQALADHVVVSIFVNPTQFAPHEDFDQYPRPLQRDLQACEAEGVHAVFTPHAVDIYPPDQPDVQIRVPQLADTLEGEFRPGFFTGVCRVCCKLFHMVDPDYAIFGKKDYQQWRIICAMVDGLNMPMQVVGHPTQRDTDGLALSSRNAYLMPDQRERALALWRALNMAKQMIEQGETNIATLEQAMTEHLRQSDLDVDYAVVRRRHDLHPIEHVAPHSEQAVALIAARLDAVRLIDNLEL